jgi:hypothetical protein
MQEGYSTAGAQVGRALRMRVCVGRGGGDGGGTRGCVCDVCLCICIRARRPWGGSGSLRAWPTSRPPWATPEEAAGQQESPVLCSLRSTGPSRSWSPGPACFQHSAGVWGRQEDAEGVSMVPVMVRAETGPLLYKAGRALGSSTCQLLP